jgi:hypothetical protein
LQQWSPVAIDFARDVVALPVFLGKEDKRLDVVNLTVIERRCHGSVGRSLVAEEVVRVENFFVALSLSHR